MMLGSRIFICGCLLVTVIVDVQFYRAPPFICQKHFEVHCLIH